MTPPVKIDSEQEFRAHWQAARESALAGALAPLSV